MCRKLETEEEKVVPFYTETVTPADVVAAAAELAAGLGNTTSDDTDNTDSTDSNEAAARLAAAAAAAAAEVSAPALPADAAVPHAVAATLDGRAVSEFSALDGFWKRYNKALLDKLAVEKERAALAAENAQLKALLQQYLSGISVAEDVLAADNTLFVVNGRTSALRSVPVGDARVTHHRPTVVDARDVVHTMRLASHA
jgi:hypothetical protein